METALSAIAKRQKHKHHHSRVGEAAALFGRNPTIQEKIIHVGTKLGVNPASMQGAAFQIFDSQILNPQVGRTTLTFFQNTSNKSQSFSNLQQGFLNAGEFLGVEEISFVLSVVNSNNLTVDTTAVNQSGSFSEFNFYPAPYSLMTFTIANQDVYKDYPIVETNPLFNPDNTGVAAFTAGSFGSVAGRSVIRLKANPVIPPNQKFQLTLTFPDTSQYLPPIPNTYWCVSAFIGRTGSIFASKTVL